MQRGWDSLVSDNLETGYKWVKTITLDELRAKYNINFDTLVLDCEGAFYNILLDMPEIMDNIKLIIIENDFKEKNQKNYVDSVFTKNNFEVIYHEEYSRSPFACKKNFFEVWKKK